MPLALRAAVAGAALLATACSSTTSPATGSRTPAASSGGTPAVSPSSSPAPTVASPTPTAGTATLAQCPSRPLAASSVAVVHRGGGPDDITADAAGGMWVSDTPAGTVYHLTAAGGVDITIRGMSSPEGVVILPGGDLLVAEQGHNRVLRVHPPDGSRSVFATLPPASGGAEGVDGIGWDPATERVLIPDSPHGTMLVAPLSNGAALSQLATGLGRPVGVVVGPDGALYVTAEDASPRGLIRIGTGGAARSLGSLRQLDDIVLLHGLFYVTDLAAGSVHAVDPGTGADRTVVTGMGQPQGLTALPDGRLAVADSTTGTIRVFAACG